MTDRNMPNYPIYIPSKGRYEEGLTPKFLIKDGVPFYLVVEPQEADEYGERYGHDNVLILPWSGDDKGRQDFTKKREIENGGLIAARNWIKEHAIMGGHKRHWQLDDNIAWVSRRYKKRRIKCDSGVAFMAVEDFVDRYENIAIAGMNYEMFAIDKEKLPPFNINCHVYSCSLVLNDLPYKWRVRYNDDTDICLQVLAGGWCTVLVNTFLIWKKWTMHTKGGNTDDLYHGDGRLKMARSLERLWPGVVKTGRRFNRPQHVIKNAWKRFDTSLKLKSGINLSEMKPNEYGM